MFNFSLINLWCAKNLVDSQYMIWKLLSYQIDSVKEQINYISDPYSKEVEYVFLNTCWFLSSWRQEMIKELKNLLKDGKIVYLLGCAVQYFRMRSNEKFWLQEKNLSYQMKEYLKEKDQFNEILKNNSGKVFLLSWEDLDHISIKRLKKWYNSRKFSGFVFQDSIRAYTNAIYCYEYLKISEWCDNHCSFCIIPKIRWKQKSLPMDKILQEAQNMIYSWIKEIIIISQDTARYGIDLYWKPKLFELLEKLDCLEWNFVYRLLYLYPDVITLNHLKKLKKLKRFLPYFDVPLQHISVDILKKMWRFYDTNYIYKFLDFINKNFENPFIRTNFIVWFPWETEKDFQQLLKFLKKDYFDNIALFQYHDEPLAASSKLPNKVDNATLSKRFKTLSKLVDDLIKKRRQKRSQKQIGYVMDFSEEKVIVRPYLHCPEIDEYDEISYDQVIWVYSDQGFINLWEMIQYQI